MTRWHRDAAGSSRPRHAAGDATSDYQIWERGGAAVVIPLSSKRKQKWNGTSCGKVTVRLISGTWVATAPESLTIFSVLVLYSLRGGSTAVTPDTVVDESRKRMADRVTGSPVRLFSRDGTICYYLRLEYDFLLLCLDSCFLLLYCSPSLIRVCFSSSYYFVRAAVIRNLRHVSQHVCTSCVICILPRLIIIRAKRVSNCYIQEKKNWPSVCVCVDVRLVLVLVWKNCLGFSVGYVLCASPYSSTSIMWWEA